MATSKELGISNVAERIVDVTYSDGNIEALAAVLEKCGGVVKVTQGDVERMNGRVIRLTISPDADVESDDTEVTIELV